MQIDKQISERTNQTKAANKLQISNSKLEEDAVRTESLTKEVGMQVRRGKKANNTDTAEVLLGVYP